MALTDWEVWAQGVLQGVAAPVDSVDVDTLWAWSGAESLPRDRMSWCNPLNTTEPWPGAVPMNSVGVRRYLTIQDGISATVMTLKNGHYPAIIANLRNSVPRGSWANACANLGTWGTGCGWFTTDYGPPPTNLGEDMTPAQDAALTDTHNKVNEVWDLLRTGTHAAANPRWIFDELEAIKAAVANVQAGSAALTPAQAAQLTSAVAILTRIENSLKAA